MTQSYELQAIAVEALKGATAAGDSVYSALDWPTWDGRYPVIYLSTPSEDKESLGRNGPPQFTVVATLKVAARAQVGAQPNGASAALLQRQLSWLSQQIQVALVNNPVLEKRVQQVAFIRTETELTASANQEQGEVVVSLGLEFYQGPEDFYQLEDPATASPFDPVAELSNLKPIEALEGVTIISDLTNMVDKTGIYESPPFPEVVTPAPRTVGPDGRAEAEIGLTFIQ